MNRRFIICVATALVLVALTAPAAAAKPDVLIISAEDDLFPGNMAAVKDLADASGRFGNVEIFNASTENPTLAYLQNFESVLIFQYFTSFFDSDALGDLLADYIDGGGTHSQSDIPR